MFNSFEHRQPAVIVGTAKVGPHRERRIHVSHINLIVRDGNLSGDIRAGKFNVIDRFR